MLLEVSGLHAFYGKSHILHGVDFAMSTPKVTALLGRNGSGRSTLLKAMMGLLEGTRGSVRIAGREVGGLQADKVCRAGLAYVPEERQVFANLTVDENLTMGVQSGVSGAPKWSREDMFAYFPRLAERRNQLAGLMSGGEQQMLTICRSLLTNPLVILIDEPTEGLAPKIVDIVAEVIRDIQTRGVAVLLVEQKMSMAMRVASDVMVMGHGSIVFTGSAAEMEQRSDIRRKWLEVA